MNRAITATLGVVRVTGAAQVVLGLLFWSGRQLALVPLHMAIGLAFVLGLWALAGLAAMRRIGMLLVLFTTLWGIAVLGFGMTQAFLLPGPMHWVVKALHLALGMIAMGLANLLAVRSTRSLVVPIISHPRPSDATEGSLSSS